MRGDFFIARGLTLASDGDEDDLKAEATDRAGNKTTVQNHSVTLDNSLGITYGYDNNGNLTSRTSEGQTTYYHYNYQNQLEFVNYPSGYDVQYFYDGIGRKYMAQYGTYNPVTKQLDSIQTSMTRKYVYAGGVMIPSWTMATTSSRNTSAG